MVIVEGAGVMRITKLVLKVGMNEVIEGFRGGELTLLAARPSIGKTDLMNEFVLQAAKNHFMRGIKLFAFRITKAHYALYFAETIQSAAQA